jgi:hypothetical protein
MKTMSTHQRIEPALIDALDTVSTFIHKVTGAAPTQSEIADALTRYFVLKEIKEHVEMIRNGSI